MKPLTLFSLALVAILAAVPAFGQQTAVDLVEAGVAAYNSHDLEYFQTHLAEDVVWADEDGHIMAGKSVVLGFIGRQLEGTEAPTLTVSNVRAGGTADAAWATFAYTLEGGDERMAGLNTTVFKRVGGDWRIALVHGAVNAEGHH